MGGTVQELIDVLEPKETRVYLPCQADGSAEVSNVLYKAVDELGKRALKTRERRCEAMREKIETYERLLGRSMDGMKARLEGLRASVVAAVMMADDAE